MSWIEEFLFFISSCELLENKANILGFIWLLTLMYFAYGRFKGHFENGYLPNKKTNRKLWIIVVFLVSFYAVFMFQLIFDDLITTPINLLFGSWELRQPVLGPLTFLSFFSTKWDVWAILIIFAFFFYIKGLWQFFRFTKYSAIWLMLIIVFSFVVANQHWWTHLRYDGWMRVQVFWLSYPEYRILTGLFFSSILKKPKLTDK